MKWTIICKVHYLCCIDSNIGVYLTQACKYNVTEKMTFLITVKVKKGSDDS